MDLERLFQHGRERLAAGDPGAAAKAFLGILEQRPDLAPPWMMLGIALRDAGRLDAAIEAYKSGLTRCPRSAELWINLGQVLHVARRLGEAEVAFRRALELGAHTFAVRGLVQCLVGENAWEEAERVYEQVPPRSIAERWDQLRILPIVYPDVETIQSTLERYRLRLEALESAVSTAPAGEALDAAQDAFHLHYTEGSHVEEQRRFGRILGRVAMKAIPVSPPARRLPGERIRVGFCSSVLCDHTVARLFGSWIEDLDRSRFDVYGYHLGARADAVTERFAKGCAGFSHLPRNPIAAASKIQEDSIHALIFPELGMDVTTLKVAALRLAPFQACTWGHPVTTGLQNVDVFLTSALMEPENGAENYTEELVRLPNLGISVGPPSIAPALLSRADFGLPEGVPLLFTAQTLFKLLPTYDAWYADLAEAVPDGILVFLAHHAPGVTRAFCERLERVFFARGMEFAARVVVLPHQPWDRYLALNRMCDVFLDAPAWSGGMTTLDALSQGLVPVTRPGSGMRQRHTAAILGFLGVTDTVVSDRAPFVSVAARLAMDASWRRMLQQRIADELPRLYADRSPIRALETLLVNLL